MFTTRSKVTIIVSALIIIAAPLYVSAQSAITPPAAPPLSIKTIETETLPAEKPVITVKPLKEKSRNVFLDFINKRVYAAAKENENDKNYLREEWKKLLKLDVFFPYFKAKEVEDWVSEKASFHLFKIKGRPRLENNQFKYIFKIKF